MVITIRLHLSKKAILNVVFSKLIFLFVGCILISIFFYVIFSIYSIQRIEKNAMEINGISRIIYYENNFPGNISIIYRFWKNGEIILNNETNEIRLKIDEQSIIKKLKVKFANTNLTFDDFIIIEKENSIVEVK